MLHYCELDLIDVHSTAEMRADDFRTTTRCSLSDTVPSMPLNHVAVSVYGMAHSIAA